MLSLVPGSQLAGLPGYTETELYHKELGMDCVSWGAGLKDGLDTAHVADEYVDTEELKRTVDLYEKLIRKMCL